MTYSTNKSNLIPAHGGYRNLKSYQTSTLVYDLTVGFCNRFVKESRMRDQMVQAARSGRQNIAEGSQASGTSKKTEIKLVNVARASLEELLLDYEDYLRQHRLKTWTKIDSSAQAVRALAYKSNRTNETYKAYIQTQESFANTLVCLIHQANYLLDQQLRALEKDFLEHGGFTERLYNMRKQRQ
ncbi:MAG TPA: four helix bundle suffix domain-containing protein [Candidatus Paceibacterota bacterium]